MARSLCFLLVLAACGETDARPALDVLRAGHLEALDNDDVEGYLKLFDENARMMQPGGLTVEGRRQIGDVVRPVLESFRMHETEQPRAVWWSGDRACEWGDLTVTLTPRAGGDPITAKGTYLFLLRRGEDRWRFSHMIWNSVEPAPPSKEPRSRARIARGDAALAGAVDGFLSDWAEAERQSFPETVRELLSADPMISPPGREPLVGDAILGAQLGGDPRHVADEVISVGDSLFVVGRTERVVGADVHFEKFIAVLDLGDRLTMRWWLTARE